MTTKALLTDRTFNEGLMVLAVNYGLDLSGEGDRSERDRAYARLLKNTLSAYPDRAVGRAFDLILKRCKWRPTVADFAEILDPAPEVLAKKRWGLVLGVLEAHGGLYNSSFRTDGATAEAVRAVGGWHHLSGQRSADLSRLAPAFAEAYARAAARGLHHQEAVVGGIREVDWRTRQYFPLTEISLEPSAALEISHE